MESSSSSTESRHSELQPRILSSLRTMSVLELSARDKTGQFFQKRTQEPPSLQLLLKKRKCKQTD